MVTVKVVRWGAGALGGASLLTLGALPGCAADAADEAVDTDDSAYTVQNAGTGTFNVEYAYGTGSGYAFAAHNSLDEYVRVGERMSLVVPAYFLWSRLYPNDALPSDLARLKKLRASVKLSYQDKGKTARTKTVTLNGWTGSQPWDLSGTSSSFTIPAGTDAVEFEVSITDAGKQGARVDLKATDFATVQVFGGELPLKHALFDNLGPDKRTRVVEGGQPVRGATANIVYTDWRAQTVVDQSSIDRQIGVAKSFGRFGAFDLPIFGELQFEISFGHAFDGAWNAETALTANAQSRLMPPFGRTAYEGSVAAPATARALDVYFHIKAYLVVDYSRFGNVTWRKYNQGDRILVREIWDNPNGPGTNYHFDLEAR